MLRRKQRCPRKRGGSIQARFLGQLCLESAAWERLMFSSRHCAVLLKQVAGMALVSRHAICLLHLSQGVYCTSPARPFFISWEGAW